MDHRQPFLCCSRFLEKSESWLPSFPILLAKQEEYKNLLFSTKAQWKVVFNHHDPKGCFLFRTMSICSAESPVLSNVNKIKM